MHPMCLMQGLQDPHAKVRWAACQAVGQMCTDLGPDIQNDEHAVIVPALTEVMKDFNEPRVQAHAAAAIVNFSENCDEEILTGYLDNLITQLLGLLQNGQKLVKVGSELITSYSIGNVPCLSSAWLSDCTRSSCQDGGQACDRHLNCRNDSLSLMQTCSVVRVVLFSCCLCCWVAGEVQTSGGTLSVTSGSLCRSGSSLPSVSSFGLQEGALTALASVADAANAHFIRYYDTVMPMLKHILYSASSKAEQLLRAKALECVSLVGMAVGKERFRADAQEVMAFMQQLQVSFLCSFLPSTYTLLS